MMMMMMMMIMMIMIMTMMMMIEIKKKCQKLSARNGRSLKFVLFARECRSARQHPTSPSGTETEAEGKIDVKNVCKNNNGEHYCLEV